MKGKLLGTDFVSILEAIYSVDQPADAWMKQILSVAAPSLDAGAGIAGLLYEIGDDPPVKLNHIDDVGVPDGWRGVGIRHHACPELQGDIKLGYQNFLCADLKTFGKVSSNFGMMYADYKQWNILGSMLLNACDTSAKGACLYLFSRSPFKVSPRRIELLAHLATHLATGYRLQQRLAATKRQVPVEAVLTTRGRIEHVEDVAKSDEARSNLKEAVEQRRWAQGRARKDDPEKAIAVWRGLITGRWTLVDQFDRGGQRYIVARENIPKSLGPETLSKRERQVVALAALGRTNKLIAYELDLAHATVRVLMARAAQKLGAKTRPDLLSRFKASSESASSSFEP